MDTAAEAISLQQKLLETQNQDGGWGFQGKTSWTEPTAFAVLALRVAGLSDACDRATSWLRKSQQPDGGWSPQPQVGVSTWLTSLVTLALLGQDWPEQSRRRALHWIQGQVRPAPSPLLRLIAEVRGERFNDVDRFGDSWYPGTASWIFPTAFTVLALRNAQKLTGWRDSDGLIRRGQQYLLSHRCPDAGWNHGGSRFGDEQPPSYPEMTGVALLALAGLNLPDLLPSVKRAQQSIIQPQSGEGFSWLLMGLSQHGIPTTPESQRFAYRTPREIALRLLALTAKDARNFLVSAHT